MSESEQLATCHNLGAQQERAVTWLICTWAVEGNESNRADINDKNSCIGLPLFTRRQRPVALLDALLNGACKSSTYVRMLCGPSTILASAGQSVRRFRGELISFLGCSQGALPQQPHCCMHGSGCRGVDERTS